MNKWKFELGEEVEIECSGEVGHVIARAEYLADEDRYLVRYKAGDGRAVESWWAARALV